MRALHELKQEAEQAAEWRGHELGKWIDMPALTGKRSIVTCIKCGEWVQVQTHPAPNSIDIGGPLVAVNCTPRQEE